jgi:hypothetical protein
VANRTLPKIVMAKLLHLNRPSKRVGNVVTTWLALRLQKRRRKRATQAVPAPVPLLLGGYYAFDESEVGWADMHISWTIEYGSFPVASVEIFWRVVGGPEASLGTVPSSDGSFTHTRASVGNQELAYRLQYVYEATAGTVRSAFSNSWDVYVDYY